MARPRHVVLALCACLPALGCDAIAPYLRNDVPYAYQRQMIERRDPYPYNDIAPAMVGVRPPDFDPPAPEAVRARWGPTPPALAPLPIMSAAPVQPYPPPGPPVY